LVIAELNILPCFFPSSSIEAASIFTFSFATFSEIFALFASLTASFFSSSAPAALFSAFSALSRLAFSPKKYPVAEKRIASTPLNK